MTPCSVQPREKNEDDFCHLLKIWVKILVKNRVKT